MAPVLCLEDNILPVLCYTKGENVRNALIKIIITSSFLPQSIKTRLLSNIIAAVSKECLKGLDGDILGDRLILVSKPVVKSKPMPRSHWD